MKPCSLSATKERLLLAAIALSTFMISSQFDFLEKLVGFSQKHEKYEIDELFSVCVVLVFCQAVLLHRRWVALRQGKKILAQQHRELEDAMAEIKQLKGIIPICASCKKMRDDEGYWHQVETYLSTHSDAEFSHGICPDCLKELYGEFLDDTP